MRRARPLLLALLALAPFAPLAADAPPSVEWAPDIDLPEGFVETVVTEGLTGATAMDVAPTAASSSASRPGPPRRQGRQAHPEPFVTLKVDNFWERGLIGVTFDRDFPKSGYVYVCYVAPTPHPHHLVSRFTAKGDVAAPGSDVVLLEGDDQTKLGGSVPAGHQGGAVHVGKDGKLYVAIGEQTAGAPAQRLDTFQGKLLRINPDGSIPRTTPFTTRRRANTGRSGPTGCATRSPSPSSRGPGASSSTTWATPAARRSTRGRPAPTTAGRSRKGRPPTRITVRRCSPTTAGWDAASPAASSTTRPRRNCRPSTSASTSSPTTWTTGSASSTRTTRRPWRPSPRAWSGGWTSRSRRTARCTS